MRYHRSLLDQGLWLPYAVLGIVGLVALFSLIVLLDGTWLGKLLTWPV